MSLVLLFVFNSTYKWVLKLFVFPWLISLSILPLRSTHVVTNGKISCFLWLSSFHCINITHLPYLFIYWWTLMAEVKKRCYYEHWDTFIFQISVFMFFKFIARSGIFGSYVTSIFSFFKETLYCSMEWLYNGFIISALTYISTNSVQMFPFSTSLSFVILVIFDSIYFHKYEMISQWSFDLYLSDD